jgi:hypothetical protein
VTTNTARYVVLLSVAFPFIVYNRTLIAEADDAESAARGVADGIRESGTWSEYHVKVESQEQWRIDP